MRQALSVIVCVAILSFCAYSCKSLKHAYVKTDEFIEVEYPETYELANIILSLTEYGKTDKWEVRKGFDYYHKVQEFFAPMSNHPLLDSVNYSRERWEEYLSFRTDAYAFEFDRDNRLKRKFDFYAIKGVTAFDDHLCLINDFVEKSKFRDFFEQNKSYYETVSDKYGKTQYLQEMRNFLIREFGEQYSNNNKYKIVLSPFVYRMNCHRNIDTTTVADFITLPDYVLSDTITINEKDLATSIHNLFTEMDHGYVNPTTIQWEELVAKNFNANLWDNKSGYNEGDKFGVFNEYMTWAVYDIFLQEYFPHLADEVGLSWSFQNDSRGFKYSRLFTQKLLELYNRKESAEKLKDLYPEMLEWTSKIQKGLSKPTIECPKDSMMTKSSEMATITISFSEPMRITDTITAILLDGRGFKQYIDLNHKENNLTWTENGDAVSFEISLPENRKSYYLQFNWWGVKYPVISKKGVLLESGSYFKINNQ